MSLDDWYTETHGIVWSETISMAFEHVIRSILI